MKYIKLLITDIKNQFKQTFMDTPKQSNIKKAQQKIARTYASAPIYDDFVVIDLETTGLSPQYNKIIEIGAVKIINKEIVDTFSALINPHIKIPRKITAINGITNDMVKKAPDIEIVIPEFLGFIETLPLVAHNASFDLNFLEHNIGQSFKVPIIDTLKFCRNYFPYFPNHKLQTVCDCLNIKSNTYHRALADCAATANVYLECKKEYEMSTWLPTAKKYEKEGIIEEAIKFYELLIENNFDGNYPYDRLAIIYRRMKDYKNEVRVISHAIWVFENVVSPARANRENKLEKFYQRLQKAEALMSKNMA